MSSSDNNTGNKTVEEILSKLVDTYKADSKVHYPNYFEVEDAAKSLDAHYLQLVLEIIGEDNREKEYWEDHRDYEEMDAREELRAELREAFKQALGTERNSK